MDDPALRETAARIPVGFLSATPGEPIVLDEVQRVPELLLALKLLADRDTRPGRALLTGSANILTFPGIADALTGRIALETLWPLSQAEIEGANDNLVDRLMANAPPRLYEAPIGPGAWLDRAVAGGFPEARSMTSRARGRWFENYVRTTVTRDLRDLDDVRRIDMVPRLLTLLAERAGGIVVWTNLARDIGLQAPTIRSYARLLQSVYAISILPAWRPGVGRRELAAPKVLLTDSGLLAHILRLDGSRAIVEPALTGKLFENFVAMELVKHLARAEVDARPYHYRDTARRGGTEIDLVIEDLSGRLVAVEMKATASPTRADWAALEWLRDRRSDRFLCGVVIYTGEQTVPLGDRLWALPVSALWTA